MLDKACRGVAGLAEFRNRLTPYRQRIKSPRPLHALQWHSVSRELHAMKQELATVVWEARLTALLDGI